MSYRHRNVVLAGVLMLSATAFSGVYASPGQLPRQDDTRVCRPAHAAVMDLWLATSLALVVVYCRRRRSLRRRPATRARAPRIAGERLRQPAR